MIYHPHAFFFCCCSRLCAAVITPLPFYSSGPGIIFKIPPKCFLPAEVLLSGWQEGRRVKHWGSHYVINHCAGFVRRRKELSCCSHIFFSLWKKKFSIFCEWVRPPYCEALGSISSLFQLRRMRQIAWWTRLFASPPPFIPTPLLLFSVILWQRRSLLCWAPILINRLAKKQPLKELHFMY